MPNMESLTLAMSRHSFDLKWAHIQEHLEIRYPIITTWRLLLKTEIMTETVETVLYDGPVPGGTNIAIILILMENIWET